MRLFAPERVCESHREEGQGDGFVLPSGLKRHLHLTGGEQRTMKKFLLLYQGPATHQTHRTKGGRNGFTSLGRNWLTEDCQWLVDAPFVGTASSQIESETGSARSARRVTAKVEREGGAFGVGELGCLPPGRHCEEPLVCFASLLEEASVTVNARACSR